MKKLFYFPIFFSLVISFFVTPSAFAESAPCGGSNGFCLCSSKTVSGVNTYCKETEEECDKACGGGNVKIYEPASLSTGNTPSESDAAYRLQSAGVERLTIMVSNNLAAADYEAKQKELANANLTVKHITEFIEEGQARLKPLEDKVATLSGTERTSVEAQIVKEKENIAGWEEKKKEAEKKVPEMQAIVQAADEVNKKSSAAFEAAVKYYQAARALRLLPDDATRKEAYANAKIAYEEAKAEYGSAASALSVLSPRTSSASSAATPPPYEYACTPTETKGGVLWLNDLEACRQCGDCKLNDFVQIGVNIANFILGIAGSLAFLMFIVGGVLMLASAGNKTMVDKGTNTIKNAVIGLLIVLFAYAIIQFTFKIFSLDWKGSTTVPTASTPAPAALSGGYEPY